MPPPLVVTHVAILSPDCGEWSRGIAMWMSWLGHPLGILAMVSLIVVHGFRPVFSGLEECVGFGKGGKTSPGLWAGIVSTRERNLDSTR